MGDVKNNLDFLVFLVKKRRKIFTYTSLIILVSIIIVLLVPKWYKSSCIIVPADQNEISPIPGFLSDVPFSDLLATFEGGGARTNLYIAILKSRKLRDQIINKFNLAEVYNYTGDYYYEDLLKELDGNIEINETEEGTLEISVLDKSPKRAYNMLNSMIFLLDSLNQALTGENARENRKFLENRIRDVYTKLTILEDSLAKFQSDKSFIIPSSEMLSMISASADLQTKANLLEIQLEVLKKQLKKDDPVLYKIRTEIEATNKRISSMPPILKQSFRIMREIQIQNNILKFLIPQFEQAKLTEKRNTPTVQILDPPQIPTKKDKPKRMLIVVLIAVLTFLIIITYYGILYRYSLLENQNKIRKDQLDFILKNIYRIWSK